MSNLAAKNTTIVIDQKKGLVFDTEEKLFEHFSKDIESLEKEYFNLKSPSDMDESKMLEYEAQLESTLEQPDEIWQDDKTLTDQSLHIYIKEFPTEVSDESIYHIAIAYRTEGVPSFVYLHFPTKFLSLVEKYQRGTLMFDRAVLSAPLGAVEGDALFEGDELAIGMYQAMLKVRSDEDFPEELFRHYATYRTETIEEAEEIWRHNDSFGNVIVNFIREFTDESGKDFYYIVVTIEDSPSDTHALLFSFPTRDLNLVTRYRQGENLQAEEIVQESSH